ncbi:MAG: MMPL family transporter, partial [Bdellovibrionales bacterium]|nr:MMPL family transporter [Bdellovibrionales bacterium]
IAVDDTIHIVHSLQKRPLGREDQRVWAVGRAMHSTGKSVISTTLVICSQFAILTTSSFIPSAEYGLLCAIGLASALLFDLFLLPALIMVLFSLAESWLPAKMKPSARH